MSSEKHLNAKYEMVILNKVENDGSFSSLHDKPLTIELFSQIPDSVLFFSEGK